MRLDDAGFADKGFADRILALFIARHKVMFLREKDGTESWNDYQAAFAGDLQLVPEVLFHEALADDYGRIVRVGMLRGDEETFEGLTIRCSDIQNMAI